MARRQYSSTAQATTLSAGISNVATTVPVTAVTGWPASTPYIIVVDPDTVNEEIMLVTARGGLNLTCTRAVGGTSAVSHASGAVVRHSVYSADFDEPNAFLNSGGTVGGNVTVTGSVTSTSVVSSGAVSGTTGGFSAGVSGTTGTFSGAVSGTTGTFSSAVSGTTGTFTGVVTHPLGAVGAPSVTFTGDTNTGIYSPSADNISLATGGVQRLNIDSAGLFSGTGTSMGAWTSFTPALTNWTIGNGTILGSYRKVGRTVDFRIVVTFGTTSTYTGIPFVSGPPFTSVSVSANNDVHNIRCTYFSGGSPFAGYAYINAATPSIQMLAFNGTNGSTTNATSAVPFAFASGSQVVIVGTYEATS